MYLDQIFIKNFRIFKSLDLDLNPGLNVLVGENDSGKTALIDAIRYVLGTNSLDRSFLDESDYYNDEKLSIQLKFSNIERHTHVFVEHLTEAVMSSTDEKDCITGSDEEKETYIQREVDGL